MKRIVVLCLTCLASSYSLAQTFQDSVSNETLGDFPSQWDLVSGMAYVSQLDGSNAINIAHAGIIKPLVNGLDNNYLAGDFVLEFDAYFDKASSIYGERFEVRLWEGKSNYKKVGISYSTFTISRHGLKTSWSTPERGDLDYTIKEFQTLEPVWRHVRFEATGGKLKISMDEKPLLIFPRFQMQPTMISIGARINSSYDDTQLGITNISISGVTGSEISQTPSGPADIAIGGRDLSGMDTSGLPGTTGLNKEAAASTGSNLPEVTDMSDVETSGITTDDPLRSAMEDSARQQDEAATTAESTGQYVETSQELTEVPRLEYSGVVVVYSGVTGGTGDYTQRIEFTDTQQFPYWFETRENYDKPCTVNIHSAPGLAYQGEETPPGAKVTEYDVCEGGLPRLNVLTTLYRAIHLPEAGTFKLITALQVCNNGINKRVKGIRGQVRKPNKPDGNWSANYETVTFEERTNCQNWEPLVSCPANKYAIGVTVHFRDGDIVSPRDFLSGMELSCSSAHWM